MRHIPAAMLLWVAAAMPAGAAETPREAVLYKTPECGCCESHAEYLRDHGFAVRVEPRHDLPLLKRLAGVPDALAGCHTIMIDGYVVEGHVPAQTLHRLLRERPPLVGISLPGMPPGSPGMNGTKEEPFTIYAIGGAQPGQVFAVE